MIRWLVLAATLFLALPAQGQIALDATAHPGGAPVSGTQDHVTSGNTLASASFSTAAGARVVVAKLFADGGNASWPATLSGCSLSWTLRVSSISATFLNASGVAIYTAFASGALSGCVVTATYANAATVGATHTSAIYVWALSNSPAFTSDTAVIGNSANALNESTTAAMSLTVTPAATGSWLFGVWSHTNDGVTPTAAANTSAFDGTFTPTGSDRAVIGRFKSAGTVTTTTAASPVTFGCSTSNTFYYMAALELRTSNIAAGGATIYGRRGTRGAGQ